MPLEDPERKLDIRDPSDMAIPPLRAKAGVGGGKRDEGSDERAEGGWQTQLVFARGGRGLVGCGEKRCRVGVLWCWNDAEEPKQII